MDIIHANGYEDMSRKAANIISAQIILKNDSVLGLATGDTPIGAYAQLIEWQRKGDLNFRCVRTINLDEYCGLVTDHPQSYRRFMDEHLFNHVDIDLNDTHVPDGMAEDIDAECCRYDALIQSLGGIDLQVLGIGNNGHIGFNEPDEAYILPTHKVRLSKNTRQANARFFDNDVSQVPQYAITMGMKNIMQAKKILLIAYGEQKMDVLHRAFHGPVTPLVPASLLQLHANLTVIQSKTK